MTVTEAQKLYETAIRLVRVYAEELPFFDADGDPHDVHGLAFEALLEQWDRSIGSYQRAQRLFPNDYATTFNLALTLHKSGNDAAAVPEYQKAIELNPQDASFRMALAISLERVNRTEAAVAYGEYLRLSPTAPDADKVRARIAELTGVQAAPAPAPAAAPAAGRGGLQ